MRTRFLVVTLKCSAVIVAGCSAPAAPVHVPSPDYWPTVQWRASTPEAQGLDSGKLADMMTAVRGRAIPIHSLQVIRNGYLAYVSADDELQGSPAAEYRRDRTQRGRTVRPYGFTLTKLEMTITEEISGLLRQGRVSERRYFDASECRASDESTGHRGAAESRG
jgi:hypothetical protein